MLAAPARAGDFTAGPLDPPASLVAAAHSTVAPVSPTLEQFNDTVAQVEVASMGDASIASALTVNDVFGVAEGRASHEPTSGVEDELARAEDPARIRDGVSGPLSIANNLDQPTVRKMMAPPEGLMPWDDAGGPVALNAAAE